MQGVSAHRVGVASSAFSSGKKKKFISKKKNPHEDVKHLLLWKKGKFLVHGWVCVGGYCYAQRWLQDLNAVNVTLNANACCSHPAKLTTLTPPRHMVPPPPAAAAGTSSRGVTGRPIYPNHPFTSASPTFACKTCHRKAGEHLSSRLNTPTHLMHSLTAKCGTFRNFSGKKKKHRALTRYYTRYVGIILIILDSHIKFL